MIHNGSLDEGIHRMIEHIRSLTRQNFIAKAAFVAQQYTSMQVADFGSFLRIDCGLPSNTFNVVVLRDELHQCRSAHTRSRLLLREATPHSSLVLGINSSVSDTQ
ncbi:MAG: hypothetical protein GFH27_549287n275 [Chloroflexi bacterium AL-W]|nr:hypothetical protein [Chloroflexi bacterium AL-N1]NOK66549.1 hypothetical protein [Chloroflexi bacterium AL-N10]NOK71937.1 hypothetical protein [Chloroflexi bacterium AL-N5]NOK81194.1 hypothetical protein [Chloroflexi bacterium AL-W]NOK89467.1 hypothetical protein [Chloroflexi bacterium AL-N15]